MMSDKDKRFVSESWPRPKFDRRVTRPAWAVFKTAEEGIAVIMSYIL